MSIILVLKVKFVHSEETRKKLQMSPFKNRTAERNGGTHG